MTSTAFVGCGGVAVRRVAQRSAICVPMRVKRAGGLHSGPVMTKWFMSTDTVSPKEFITDALQNSGSRVVIFSKSTCPFCARVKQLFDSMGEPYNAIELNKVRPKQLLTFPFAKRLAYEPLSHREFHLGFI